MYVPSQFWRLVLRSCDCYDGKYTRLFILQVLLEHGSYFQGVMQIGWATKDSKFLNHVSISAVLTDIRTRLIGSSFQEGCGIGDDEFSVAYDGCRQLIWHNASCQSQEHPPWRPGMSSLSILTQLPFLIVRFFFLGDVLGCLLDLDRRKVIFYLNGVPLQQPHTQVFQNARSGFFAAASFMSFQQCQFNFGNEPFRFAPAVDFETFNNHAVLNEEQRVILPRYGWLLVLGKGLAWVAHDRVHFRHKKLEILRDNSVAEGSCSLCFSNPATVTLKPCNHR